MFQGPLVWLLINDCHPWLIRPKASLLFSGLNLRNVASLSLQQGINIVHMLREEPPVMVHSQPVQYSHGTTLPL